MGIYLNPGDDNFRMARRSRIYVDKSALIDYLNSVFQTEERFVCVSRPRRFGKSMAANMVTAYYDRTVQAEETFHGLQITQAASFSTHCNKYDVIHINMQDFLSRAKDMDDLLQMLAKSILWELLEEYPDYPYFDKTDLARTMADVYQRTKRAFVIVIDEWDCVFREYSDRKDWQEKYLDFLRSWLKDKSYIGLAYMTGILPIKKYGTHSALNMFNEFSMTNPRELAPYVGFTEEEVRLLCEKYGRDFEQCKAWYDGYHFPHTKAVYNPRSVVSVMTSGIFDTYWNQTETFEALMNYIRLDIGGLRGAIISLMAGAQQKIDMSSFANDMTSIHTADDAMTLLVHLGYLGYDFDTKEVFIPNREIQMEYATATKASGWSEVVHAIQQSEALLQSTLAKDEVAVAKGIEEAHMEMSHLQYNDENALSYAISLAYYSAREQYSIIRELPAGKGFADLVFIPRKQYADMPALLVELKWGHSTNTAIQQIKEKKYAKALDAFAGKILLIGISYDKETKKHSCKIEEWEKK